MLNKYDPNEQIIVWSELDFSGWAEQTFITVEKTENSWDYFHGAGNDATITKNNNNSGMITCVFLHSAEINTLLVEKLKLGEGATPHIGAFSMTDEGGQTVVEASQVWIEKPANIERSKEAATTTWVFKAHDIKIYSGGNVLASPVT